MTLRAPRIRRGSILDPTPLEKAISYALLILWAFVCLFPLYWLFVTSFKLPIQVDAGPFYVPFVDFQPSLHAEICQLAGLSLEPATIPRSGQPADAGPRDPSFRDRVLVAYEYRCAFCGYDGWLDGMAVALERVDA
jgi:ABC-type glycerol-3-phosphate transport system permease component